MTGIAEPQSGRLSHLGTLRLSGPDALAFLQGQISNDTRRLAEGAPLFAAYSTPQGRVLSLMHLLPHSGSVVCILPRELVVPTADRLRRFVLRAKVKIEDTSDSLWVAGHHGIDNLHASEIGRPQNTHGYVETDGIGVASVGHDVNRYWVIGDPAKLTQYRLVEASGSSQSAVSRGSLEEKIARDWRVADIAAGLPQVYAATSEAFVAQMLNVDLLDGISFTKGCYTGQEIIARTQHLGRIKRRMSRLVLPPGDWSIGQPLRLHDGRSGRLTEIVQVDGAVEALAVLTLPMGGGLAAGGGSAAGVALNAAESPDSETSAAGDVAVAATELPLPYKVA
jgi:tRNA-modifying protein YgfZ